MTTMWTLKPAKLRDGAFYCNGCGCDLYIRVIQDGVDRGQIGVAEGYTPQFHEKLGREVFTLGKNAREKVKRGRPPKFRRKYVIPQPDGTGWHIGERIGRVTHDVMCVCTRVQVITKNP